MEIRDSKIEIRNRREFLQQSAAAVTLTGIAGASSMARTDKLADAGRYLDAEAGSGAKWVAARGGMQDATFAARQEERRKELWGLLGDLPTQHVPGRPKVVST